MNREDYKLLPLAAIGLVIGIGEVIVKPFLQDTAAQTQKVAKAAIHYYTTGGEQ